MDNVREYIEPYLTFDSPIPYKELELNSVKVKDYFKFMSAYDILNIDKNKIPDVEVIQMNYLQFISNLVLESPLWKNKFLTILNLTFGLNFDKEQAKEEFVDNEILTQEMFNGDFITFINGWDCYFYIKKNKRTSIYIKDIEINSTEFNDIIKIILFQNMVDYDDEEMNEDFKRVVEEFYRLKNKGTKVPTLEDKILAVMTKAHYSKDNILEMPFRTFELLFKSIVGEVEYLIGKIAQTQGYKGDVEHWIYKSNKHKYAEVFSSADGFRERVTSI